MRLSLRLSLVVGLVAVSAATPVAAQRHPDLSGHWVFDPEKSTSFDLGSVSVGGKEAQPAVLVAPSLGPDFTATEQSYLLKIARDLGGQMVTFTYDVTGKQTTNTSPPANAGEPPLKSTSTAKWTGDRLTITSAASPLDARGKPVKSTITRVLSLRPDGTLLIETSGTPADAIPATVSIYRKSSSFH